MSRVIARWSVCAAAVSFVLASCAIAPKESTHAALRPVATFDADKSLAASNGQLPAEDWWITFADPQLDGLMEEVGRQSPTIAEANARIVRAEAQAGISTAALYPSISAGGAALYGRTPPGLIGPGGSGKTLGILGLDFSWEIDFWGRNRSALKASLSELEANRAESAATTLMVATSVADAYAELYGLYEQRDVGEAAVKLRGETQDLVKRRVEQGLDNQLALREAAANVQSESANLEAINEAMTLQRNLIAQLLGNGPDWGASLSRPQINTMALGLPANLQVELIGRKPEVVAARWHVEAAARRIGVAKTAFYPNVNLLGIAGFLAPEISNLFRSPSQIASAGPAVTLPIFDGGKLRANYRVAGADYDIAVNAYNDAILQALRQAADAAASLRALAPRREDTDAARDELEKAYRLARLRYEGGLANYETVLIAEQAVLAARNASTSLRVRNITLDIALIRALGGGYRATSQPMAALKP